MTTETVQVEAHEEIDVNLYPEPAIPVVRGTETFERFVGRANKSPRQAGDQAAKENDFAQGLDAPSAAE